jgi:tRNA (guanine37-N1)-methyltransferase
MGMVIQMEPTYKALASVKTPASLTILLTPAGEKLSMALCQELVKHEHIVLLSGHYEGFDSRLLHYVDRCVSIGDYVLTGGELPSLTLTDALIRLLPGVLGNDESAVMDSFYDGLLDWDVFTRPQKFDIFNVPDVLTSGHHQNIERWKLRSSLRNTWQYRPDLLARHIFNDKERDLLRQIFVEEDI